MRKLLVEAARVATPRDCYHVFSLAPIAQFIPPLHVQKIQFGSKKQKEKVDKETKKLRRFLKISGVRNDEQLEGADEARRGGGSVGSGSSERSRQSHGANDEGERVATSMRVDYEAYDVKAQEIVKAFERKMKKIYDNNLSVDFFNNIVIAKEKQNFNLSDLAQVVMKSAKVIYFFPYMNSDAQRIIYHLKIKDNTWNPTMSNDGQHILLHIPPLTEDVKLKKRKEAKELLEKIKNDLRNLRHRVRDDIARLLQGEEWKIVERNKLDTYIKGKVKAIEEIYADYAGEGR
ncbi:ribosome recycling factor [Plasmodium inui San Antonio 1]|uniref:Ribosome recycling factor n=1 Tax=Plasmodium inui San Antonio 1 TaxID=1237626 RepID=W7A0L2_9APIC|nr:ribosome recycling factor [Plasmodium inui San Antonio 1]EUD65115.1 ribosome recycling factor [Plasmodium inui San Antonio 1]